MTDIATVTEPAVEVRPARLGFLGPGGLGRNHVEAIVAAGVGEVVAACDPAAGGYDELLSTDLDGIIVATPSAQHAEHAEAALDRGVAVFCRNPLGRDAGETRRVIDAARRANLLLGVDLPYRGTEAMRVLRSTVQAGELGDIYAVDVAFHGASGPDRGPTGDGCVLDLGMHLMDLVLWTLGFPTVTAVTSRLFAGGERIQPGRTDVAEDYATALLDLDTGAAVRLACSWNLPIGEDARIETTFYGTEGGGSFRSVNGSLDGFTAELFRGTHRHTLAAPPDAWSGRTAVAWTRALARGKKFDPWVEGVADVADALDRVLQR